jgi:predicted nucleic acid-binding protein
MAERVVVDTVIWSLALRRRRPRDLSPGERQTARLVRDLIVAARAVLLGVVRQELLSGVDNPATFESLRSHLAEFGDDPPDVDDYERAAAFANACEAGGVAHSPTDMLVCAFAAGRDLPILTADADFVRYARILSADNIAVRLYQLP